MAHTRTQVERDAAVSRDLLAACRCKYDDDDSNNNCKDTIALHDVTLLCEYGAEVPANRFVLAARSPVFRKMLYGSFREAQSSTMALLGYSERVVRAVVDFCVTDDLSVLSLSCVVGNKNNSERDTLVDLVHIAQAADYLQLTELQRLSEAHVKQRMANDPANTVSLVLETSVLGTSLSDCALTMMECRPYVCLDATVLSTEKMEAVLQRKTLAAGEWFIFQQLSKWYDHQQELVMIDENVNDSNQNHHESKEEDNDNNNNKRDSSASSTTTSTPNDDDPPTIVILKITRQLAHRYLYLSHIAPTHLLGPCRTAPWIDDAAVFHAVSVQALQASRDKVWKVQTRSASDVDRVLVEDAGCPDVNGMYYRVPDAKRTELYTKRETQCGQPHVYALSRCPTMTATTTTAPPEDMPTGDVSTITTSPNTTAKQLQSHPPNHGSFRIFSSKFLTHRATKRLQTMQATEVIVPQYQPVLQMTELRPPAMDVPTPIRKYYRVRLSDGDYHMPGTLAPDVGALVEQGELDDLHVLQVIEFGVYTIHGCAGIHVLKAIVVTTTPTFVFGAPVPLEDSADVESPYGSGDDDGGLRTLYTCSSTASDAEVPNERWETDRHGLSPAPSCVWIPADDRSGSSRTNSSGSSSGTSVRRGITSSGSTRSRTSRSTSPRSVATDAPAT